MTRDVGRRSGYKTGLRLGTPAAMRRRAETMIRIAVAIDMKMATGRYIRRLSQ